MANMTKLEIGEKVEVLITKLTVMEEKIDHLTEGLNNANKKIEDLETDAMKIEPERMNIFDNITWSSFEREELPIAWDIAMENSKCQQI